MQIEINPFQQVNVAELEAALKLAVAKITTVTVTRGPGTKTILGTVVYEGYELEIAGAGGDDQAAIDIVIQAHFPLKSTETEEVEARAAQRLIDFADIIAEAVRQAGKPK